MYRVYLLSHLLQRPTGASLEALRGTVALTTGIIAAMTIFPCRRPYLTCLHSSPYFQFNPMRLSEYRNSPHERMMMRALVA